MPRSDEELMKGRPRLVLPGELANSALDVPGVPKEGIGMGSRVTAGAADRLTQQYRDELVDRRAVARDQAFRDDMVERRSDVRAESADPVDMLAEEFASARDPRAQADILRAFFRLVRPSS